MTFRDAKSSSTLVLPEGHATFRTHFRFVVFGFLCPLVAFVVACSSHPREDEAARYFASLISRDCRGLVNVANFVKTNGVPYGSARYGIEFTATLEFQADCWWGRLPRRIRRPRLLLVVGRWSDGQHPADRLDSEGGPVLVHERHHHFPRRSSSAWAK